MRKGEGMKHAGKASVWIPEELRQAPYLMGMGLIIAFDALTPFLDLGPSLSWVTSVDAAEWTRTLLFLVAALCAQQTRSALNHPLAPTLICTLASAGVLLAQVGPYVTQPLVASLVTITGSAAIGFFWCFGLLKFCELFSKTSLRCTIATCLFCHVGGSALATAIVYLDLRVAALVLLFAIPLILLAWGHRYGSLLLDPGAPGASTETARLRIPVRPFTLMLVTLFVAALIRARIPASLEPATYFGPLVCALSLSIAMEIKRRAIHPRTLYYLPLFLLEIGLLFYTQTAEGLLVLAGACVNAGYTCFDVLILALLCNICRRYTINPYWMFGFLGFIERMAYDAGTFSGAILAHQPDQIRYVMAFGCAIAVTCAFVTLLTERDYRTSWGTMKDEAKENPVASYYHNLPDACAAIAEQFGLTRREEEVLLLLAQRKTVPDVERELFISNSTAKTHCKNIYKKLGVHKREDLLVLMGHPSVKNRTEGDAESQ